MNAAEVIAAVNAAYEYEIPADATLHHFTVDHDHRTVDTGLTYEDETGTQRQFDISRSSGLYLALYGGRTETVAMVDEIEIEVNGETL